MLNDILHYRLFHNTVSTWLLSIAIFVIGAFVITIIRSFVMRRLIEWGKNESSSLRELIVMRIKRTGIPLAYLAVAHSALAVPTWPPHIVRTLKAAGIILLAIFLVQFVVALVQFGLKEYSIRNREDNPAHDRALKAISSLLNVFVWIIGILFILDNLGFKISTVLAGLGIGGIAVALAAQAILGDMFAYFTILFDSPFEIGDRITVGEYTGTVERLGIKTTRITGLDGDHIIIANKDLTDSRVRNYKRMARRRVPFTIGVTYETGLTLLREIPQIIIGIIGEFNEVKLDRVHFLSFGDFSLNYEIVYFVESNHYHKYMDLRQAINFRIAEEFQKRGIEFAYPTQTLYMRKEAPETA